MSCGTRIEGRFGGYAEREDIVRKLEREGEYSLARQVSHGNCLSSGELRRAENALERQGMSRNFDYNEDRCRNP
jgi:hypothetical protein